jgi:hypothetical protein
MASVHPVLKALSWRVSVLIQTERRIDRRCPLSDCRIIGCYCLRYSSSEIHPTHLEIEPSDHPMVSSSFCPLRSVPSAPTLAPMVPTYCRFIRRCLFPCFSSRLQLGSLLQLNILNMSSLIMCMVC